MNIFFQEKSLIKLKKLDCALLPPCKQSLEMKVLRSTYVTTQWINAVKAFPVAGIMPCNYGWSKNDEGILMPLWFHGPELPDNLLKKKNDESSTCDNDVECIEDSDDCDIDPWSDDSDSNSEEI